MPFKNTGVVILDLEGRIAFASTYFCDVVRLEHDKVPGLFWFDFVFPEEMDEARRLLKENIAHSVPVRFRLRRSDGREVWTDILGSTMQTAGGKVYGISATVTVAEQSN